MSNWKMLCLVFAAQLLFAGCAKEQSAEERQREQQRRTIKRLSAAEGFFAGHVKVDTDKMVPVSVRTDVVFNPAQGINDPFLQATLRVGLLGGVSIVSDSSSYDWGSKRLVASFNRSSGSPLEFSGLVQAAEIVAAKLSAPLSGQLEMSLVRDGGTLFHEDGELLYAIELAGVSATAESSAGAKGLLAIRSVQGENLAPATSDLPLLPSLAASIQFDGLAVTPQKANNVLYDPLQGTAEIWFSDFSRLSVRDLFLGQERYLELTENSDKTPPYLTSIAGDVLLGSELSGRFVGAAKQGFALKPQDLSKQPPRHYSGKFIGDGLTYSAYATLQLLDAEGQNTGEQPFGSYPKLRLKLTVCLGTEPFAKSTLDLSALDYVNGRATFRSAEQTQQTYLELAFGNEWSSVRGHYKTPDAVNLESDPRIELSAVSHGVGCRAE